MLQQCTNIYVHTQAYTTYAPEWCSLLKSHTLSAEFLLTTLTAMLKVVSVSLNLTFIFTFFHLKLFHITVEIRSNNQDRAVTLPCIPTEHVNISHLQLPSELTNYSCQT
jgi:hypothetical protein